MSDERKALEVARDWARSGATSHDAVATLAAMDGAEEAEEKHRGIAERLRLLADAVDRLAKLEDAALTLADAGNPAEADVAAAALLALLQPRAGTAQSEGT